MNQCPFLYSFSTMSALHCRVIASRKNVLEENAVQFQFKLKQTADPIKYLVNLAIMHC